MKLVASSGRIRDLVLNLFFPPQCVGCGAVGDFICRRCRLELPRLEPPLCGDLGKPILWGNTCHDGENSGTAIDGIRSFFAYDGVLRQAVLQFKYNNVKVLAVPLARLMWENLYEHSLSFDTLVPVPLHPHRLRQRGYNQSALLARELGKLTSMQVNEGSLVRRRDTPQQTQATSANRRRRNVAGAFACRDRKLVNRRILIVDAVCTSGSTLYECAATLEAAGAASVCGLTLAREV